MSFSGEYLGNILNDIQFTVQAGHQGGSGSVSCRSIIGDFEGGKNADCFSICTFIFFLRYGEVRYGQMTLGVVIGR